MSVKELSQFGLSLVMTVVLGVSVGMAQEAQYTAAEYNEYQKAITDGEDAILEWISTHPDSALKQYALGEYQKLVKGYLDTQKHKETVAAAEKFLNSVDGENFEMVFLAAWSSFYSQQYDKATLYGEKAFELKPDAPQLEHLIPILARSYTNLGNMEKALPYIEKYCAGVTPKDCYDLLPSVVRHYAEAKDWRSAAKYAETTIEAFDAIEKPAQVTQAEWDNFVEEEKSVCFAVLGRNAADAKKWNSVEQYYTASRKLNPKNRARTAEGYFYTGVAQWNREMIDAAMASFAKGSFLEGTPHAEPCRKELEKLYKATHNGSLAGFEEYLDNARSW
jgi:tetratricopeptide (TPR) repeat protein